jgi:hypothetical protein
MTFSNTRLETRELMLAQNAQRNCIWRVLSRRSRASTFVPSNVRGVSTSTLPWRSSNKPLSCRSPMLGPSSNRHTSGNLDQW